jgi:hypothetical protein
VPNPFNPATRISFDLDQKGEVALEVYDVTGRLVTTLFDGEADAGPHTVTWDGTMSDGRPAASGIYWSVLRTESERASRRMVLVKYGKKEGGRGPGGPAPGPAPANRRGPQPGCRECRATHEHTSSPPAP